MSPKGRYFTAQRIWNGKPSRVKPVVEEALARAARRLDLPPPYPQLICRPDSLGNTMCSSVVRLRPGVSTIQANARFTGEITGLGAALLSGTENVSGSVSLRYRAGSKVLVVLELVPASGSGLDTTLAATPAGLPEVEVRARLALVINDYGEDAVRSRRFAELPGTFTAAVRSNLEDADRWADEARRSGMEVIVNLPMEPKNYPRRNPGDDAILVDLSGREIRKRVNRALDRVGPVTGAKTYMGSLAVEDRDVMRPVLEVLEARHLFFVNAVQSQYSTVRELAHEIGIPLYELTNVSQVDAGHTNAGTIGIRFDDLVRSTRGKGYGVGIIHARDGTLDVLADRLPALRREGIVVMGLSEIMKAHALE